MVAFGAPNSDVTLARSDPSTRSWPRVRPPQTLPDRRRLRRSATGSPHITPCCHPIARAYRARTKKQVACPMGKPSNSKYIGRSVPFRRYRAAHPMNPYDLVRDRQARIMPLEPAKAHTLRLPGHCGAQERPRCHRAAGRTPPECVFVPSPSTHALQNYTPAPHSNP